MVTQRQRVTMPPEAAESTVALKVLGISASPREGGNTDILLGEALAGAAAAGADVEQVALRGLEISPCVECYACARTGVCRVPTITRRSLPA